MCPEPTCVNLLNWVLHKKELKGFYFYPTNFLVGFPTRSFVQDKKRPGLTKVTHSLFLGLRHRISQKGLNI
jgi:hypothetical protein